MESQEVTLMKGRRHSPEQVVRKLREADKLLAEGAEVADVCRHLEVSIQTYQPMAGAVSGDAPGGCRALEAAGEGKRAPEADRG
jgi:hypothetical protein